MFILVRYVITIEETMNSFEQIKLEKETKEKLDEYQKCGSQEEVVRLNELREKYGEKTLVRLVSGRIFGMSTTWSMKTLFQKSISQKLQWVH